MKLQNNIFEILSFFIIQIKIVNQKKKKKIGNSVKKLSHDKAVHCTEPPE